MHKQYEEARKILLEGMGKDWIDDQCRKYEEYFRKLQRKYGKYALFYEKEGKYHLFVKWWLDTSHFGILRTIMLGNLFNALRNYKGFKEKVEKLKTAPNEFEKLIYEFRMAFNFVQLGWDVIFPATPDLKVSQGKHTYYVECKKKDLYGGREKEIKNIFKSVSEMAMRKWRNIQPYLIIFVKCKTSINSNDRSHLERLIKNALTQSEETNHLSDDKFDVAVENLKAQDRIMKVPYVDYPMNTEEKIKQRFIYSLTKAILGFPINPDHCTFEGDINPQNDGFLLRNIKFIGFLSKEALERFKSIEDSFYEAIGQIPERRNGLIYIELDPKISPYDVKEISERLKGKLKNHPRINAVFLTREITEKPTDEDLVKGTHYVKIINEFASPIPEYLKIPGIKGEEIKNSEKRIVLEDLVRKYTPEGFRPFGKEGSTLVLALKPYSQNKVQYYIDIGNKLDKNRVSLFHDGKSKLVLKIYTFNGKCYSVEAPVRREDFFDKDHVVLCTWNPLKGNIGINMDGEMYRKNIDTFYLEDITVRMLIGTDISKKHFAKMLCYSVQVYARAFEDEEIQELIKKVVQTNFTK